MSEEEATVAIARILHRVWCWDDNPCSYGAADRDVAEVAVKMIKELKG